jgi:hypothetical protein
VTQGSGLGSLDDPAVSRFVPGGVYEVIKRLPGDGEYEYRIKSNNEPHERVCTRKRARKGGGPYDLWRKDEPSRRVKDLVSAFAENLKLPKMLRQKEILDTVDQGVRDGIFVASLTRPDKSILSELHPGSLSLGVLPGLWKGDAITVADAINFFAVSHTVMVKRDGYDELVVISVCPAAAVEAALTCPSTSIQFRTAS